MRWPTTSSSVPDRDRVAGQGVLFDAARARRARRPRCSPPSRPYPGFEVRCHARHRHGRARLGPGEHRHRTGAGGCAAGQDVPLRPVHARPRGRRPTARYPSTSANPNEPTMTSNFLAFDEGYTGGVSLATGWVAGAEGGAKSIVTGQLGGEARCGCGRAGPASTASRACTPRAPTITTPTSSSPDRLVRAVRRRASRGDGRRPPAPPAAPICWSAGRSRRAEVRKYGLGQAGSGRDDRWRRR